MKSVTTFFRGVVNEAKRTSWLTPTEALGYTAIVIVLSVIMGYYLGLFDGIFSKVLESVIIR